MEFKLLKTNLFLRQKSFYKIARSVTFHEWKIKFEIDGDKDWNI